MEKIDIVTKKENELTRYLRKNLQKEEVVTSLMDQGQWQSRPKTKPSK